MATAFAEQALGRPGLRLQSQVGASPQYFRCVFADRTVAYGRPRQREVRTEFRLPSIIGRTELASAEIPTMA
jgi:hypothetical protein